MTNLPSLQASRSATSPGSCVTMAASSSHFPKSPLMESLSSSPHTFIWNRSSACGKLWASLMKSGSTNSSSSRLRTRRKRRLHSRPTAPHVAMAAARCSCALHGARFPKESILTITTDARCSASACHSNTPSLASSRRGSSSCEKHTASARTTSSPSMRCAMRLNAWAAFCAAKTIMASWCWRTAGSRKNAPSCPSGSTRPCSRATPISAPTWPSRARSDSCGPWHSRSAARSKTA